MENFGIHVPAYFDFDNNIFHFWLECVRQGRGDIIRDYCDEEEKRALCSRIFMEDRAYALRVCMVVWVEAVKIAEKVDVPNASVDSACAMADVRLEPAIFPPGHIVRMLTPGVVRSTVR